MRKIEDIAAAMSAHVESVKDLPMEEIYRPTPGFWESQTPTWIENWPSSLHSISIPSVLRKLTLEEARVLGSLIYELGEGFNVSDIPAERQVQIREDLVSWMDQQINMFPGGAFVRLGSRSPKDSMYWGCNDEDDDSGKVRTGEQALRRLISGSERVYEDLQRCLAMAYQPYIVLREFINMEAWQEFRCFQKAGKLVGISQYYYRTGAFPEIVKDSGGLKWAIEKFHERWFVPACPLENVVFDVFIKVHRYPKEKMYRYEVKLLEINPFFHLTDPCLFNWNKPEEFDGRFKYTEEKLWQR